MRVSPWHGQRGHFAIQPACCGSSRSTARDIALVILEVARPAKALPDELACAHDTCIRNDSPVGNRRGPLAREVPVPSAVQVAEGIHVAAPQAPSADQPSAPNGDRDYRQLDGKPRRREASKARPLFTGATETTKNRPTRVGERSRQVRRARPVAGSALGKGQRTDNGQVEIGDASHDGLRRPVVDIVDGLRFSSRLLIPGSAHPSPGDEENAGEMTWCVVEVLTSSKGCRLKRSRKLETPSGPRLSPRRSPCSRRDFAMASMNGKQILRRHWPRCNRF